MWREYPRADGDNERSDRSMVLDLGIPPRARGQQRFSLAGKGKAGNTPAHTGTTTLLTLRF